MKSIKEYDLSKFNMYDDSILTEYKKNIHDYFNRMSENESSINIAKNNFNLELKKIDALIRDIHEYKENKKTVKEKLEKVKPNDYREEFYKQRDLGNIDFDLEVKKAFIEKLKLNIIPFLESKINELKELNETATAPKDKQVKQTDIEKLLKTLSDTDDKLIYFSENFKLWITSYALDAIREYTQNTLHRPVYKEFLELLHFIDKDGNPQKFADSTIKINIRKKVNYQISRNKQK